MYTNKNFGFDDSLLNAVRGVVAKNRYMTKAQVETNIEKGFWEAETELVEGKVAYIYENATRTRNKIVIISEKKELDPVNKKALKKDFDDRKDKDIDNDGDSDDSDEYLHKRRKAISKAMKDEASCGTKRMKEDEDLEEETVYVKRRYNNLGANQYSNDVEFAKKISNAASKLGLTAKMNDKNFVISGDPEKIATLKKTVKGVTFSMKEDEDLEEGKKWKSMVQWEDAAKKLGYTVKKQGGYGPIWVAFDHKNNRVAGKYNLEDPSTATLQEEAVAELEEGKKGYKKESDDSSNDEKMTDAQKNDMDGDGEKDKKKTKKRGDKNKVDKVDTDPELENDTVVQEARSPENRKMSSYEKEKLDDLKKKHEGGKMHRALRKNYGEKGDDIFYGKLTKMATGEYDGSQSKSEEFKLTAEDLNGIESLEALAEIYYASLEDIDLEEARGRPRKGEDEDDGGSSNLIMQLRKSVSLRGQYDVKFDNGDKVKIDQRKAQTFLNRFNDLKKPAEKEALMRSASKSPKHLDMALKGKIEKPKSGKPELPPLESEK
jgi:hypothetical protein